VISSPAKANYVCHEHMIHSQRKGRQLLVSMAARQFGRVEIVLWAASAPCSFDALPPARRAPHAAEGSPSH